MYFKYFSQRILSNSARRSSGDTLIRGYCREVQSDLPAFLHRETCFSDVYIDYVVNRRRSGHPVICEGRSRETGRTLLMATVTPRLAGGKKQLLWLLVQC